MTMLFVIGSMKRDLFELRYFSGAVPAMLLLGARLVTATTRRRVAGLVAAGVLTLTMAAGLVDQQLNGANPRLYDFQGALAAVHQIDAEPNTAAAGRPVLLYEPSYLADVIAYYAPDIDARFDPVLCEAHLDRAAAFDAAVLIRDGERRVGGLGCGDCRNGQQRGGEGKSGEKAHEKLHEQGEGWRRKRHEIAPAAQALISRVSHPLHIRGSF
jgi:hypothetical protein